MVKKILEYLEKCFRYLMTLGILPFFNTIVMLRNKDIQNTNETSKIILFIFPIMLILYLIILFSLHYYENKEISKTPLNDNSAKKLNRLLVSFNKTIKKFDRNSELNRNFDIKLPKYILSKNKLIKGQNNITVTPNNKSIIAQEICNNIISLKRTLLEINKSNLRIEFGNFLVEHTTDLHQKIEGYIDFLGWTKILNCNKKGINDIKQGIELCETKVKTLITENEISNVNEYYSNIVRAYRHIGTTYYTYKFGPNLVENSINCGYEYLSKINCVNEGDIEKYTKLAVGIKYNSILFKYYDAIYNKTSENNLDKVKKEIEKLYDSIYSENKVDLYNAINVKALNSEFLDTKFIDNHRKIKINSLYAILFDNEKSIKPLKEIERILNENIYIDEAVELYIYGKINSIYNIK